MRVLLDTNIIINREADKVIEDNLGSLINNWNANRVIYLLHGLSIEEIKADKDSRRRQVSLSKLKTYPLLASPPVINDPTFLSLVPTSTNTHDVTDDNLLFCVYKDAVNFLVTEDKGIFRKARRLGISDKIFTVDEALRYFNGVYSRQNPVTALAIKNIPVNNLDITDSFFDSLKAEYPDFLDWWKKISAEGRESWAFFRTDGTIGALLILKEETDTLPTEPSRLRLKICTLKVTHTGQKIGELLLKISIDYAAANKIEEIFLTHFTTENDIFADLIKDYGFRKLGKLRGEDVYHKWLRVPRGLLDPIEIARDYYPSFYDGPNVRKHIVPIVPQYFERLFVGSGTVQLALAESTSLITEKNTITKAYICHTFNKSIHPGDILLFYRTHDQKLVLEVGTVENVHYDLRDIDSVLTLVGKRSAYNTSEIDQIVKKPTTVILFRNHSSIPTPVSYKRLIDLGILKEPPRSVTTIAHDKYVILKHEGQINERYTIH